MDNGLYHFTFICNERRIGSGVVCVRDNTINGGDNAFYYQGTVEGKNVNIKITRHDEHEIAIFGKINELTLIFNKSSENGDIHLSGFVEGMPVIRVEVNVKTLCTLKNP